MSERPPPGPTLRAARWALVVLTALNFLNYIDRQVLPAVLKQVEADPAFAGVSRAELGYLQTAFLFVYMIVSPLSGLLGRRVPRKYVVAAGVGLWSLATVWSGLARSYGELMAARAMIGFGEAGYATVAPAILSDLFARERRARILAIFYLATPVGSAIGFLVGGYVAHLWSWRGAFFVAGGPGLVAAILALFIVEPKRGAMDAHSGDHEVSLGAGLRSLMRSHQFLLVTAGTTLWVFSVGGLAFWLPSYFQEVRGLDEARANAAVGGIAVVSGILGTFAGGWLGDAWLRRDAGAHFKLSAIGLLAATPLVLAAAWVPSLTACLACIFLAEFFVFLNTGPLNTALVGSAPPSVRELGVGLHVLCIHMLGDAISPPILGALSDSLRRSGMAASRAAGAAVAATAGPLLLGGLVLLWGVRAARRAARGVTHK